MPRVQGEDIDIQEAEARSVRKQPLSAGQLYHSDSSFSNVHAIKAEKLAPLAPPSPTSSLLSGSKAFLSGSYMVGHIASEPRQPTFHASITIVRALTLRQ